MHRKWTEETSTRVISSRASLSWMKLLKIIKRLPTRSSPLLQSHPRLRHQPCHPVTQSSKDGCTSGLHLKRVQFSANLTGVGTQRFGARRQQHPEASSLLKKQYQNCGHCCASIFFSTVPWSIRNCKCFVRRRAAEPEN